MPIGLIVPNAGLLRLIWNLPGGGGMINVLGIALGASGAVDQTVANTIGALIKGSLTSTGLNGHIHTSVSLANVGVRDIRSAHQTEFLDTGGPVVGTASGDALPRGNALCITLRTNQAGPSFRGRVYLGGFAEGDNDSDATASSTILPLAVNFVSAIQTHMRTAGWDMGVVSRPGLQKEETLVVTFPDGHTETHTHFTPSRTGRVTPVTAIMARNDVWDSQRRRSAPGSVSTFMAPLVRMISDTGELATSGKVATHQSTTRSSAR